MERVEPGGAVMQRALQNPFRTYKNKGLADSAKSAALRIRSAPFCPVHSTTKFSISRGARIFTMGSCFAREIERSLQVKGASLLSRRLTIPKEILGEPVRRRAAAKSDEHLSDEMPKYIGILNQYTPRSMTTELTTALEHPHPETVGLVDLKDGYAFDLRHGGMKPGPKSIVTDINRQIVDLNRTVRNADVLILTFGYTETWIYGPGSVAVNGSPPLPLLRRYPNEFSFYNANYSSVLADIDRLFLSLRKHCKPDLKIILTVSPVPLGDTFTSADSIVANTRSKATLLASVQDFVADHPNFDYFPSYEMVIHSSFADVWEEDGVHIQRPIVNRVVDVFLERYFPSGVS